MSGKPPPPPHLSTNYQGLLAEMAKSKSSHDTLFSNKTYLSESFSNVDNYHSSYLDTALVSKKPKIEKATVDSDVMPDFVLKRKEEEILNLLKQFPRPVSTKEIIQNCGHFFKPLQPLLYSLHDRGLILKCSGFGTQAWKINQSVSSQKLNNFPQQTFLSVNLESPNSLSSSSSGSPLPPHLLFTKSSPFSRESQSPFYVNTTSSFAPPISSFNKTIEQPFQMKKCESVSHTVTGLTSDTFNVINKNPVSALNEFAQKKGLTVSFELLCEGKGFKNRFTVAAIVGEQMYDAVSGSNMKDAKREAADIALRAILGNNATTQGGSNSSVPSHVLSPQETSLTHFDKIASLTHEAFLQLSTMVNERFAGRKVVAGMVMKNGYEDLGCVVALGTGNRCITGQRLSLEGKVVNDSHAEIICRRAFIRYLYSQLKSFFRGDKSSIFESGGMNDKAKIKDDVSFHLYISTAPCGDSALFTPQQANHTSDMPKEHAPEFSSKPHGILRTKIEDGEGTIPVNPDDVIQTFDGILRGQRLRTMSCSDKVCRWNTLGLQGALLSHLIDPVYLDSLTLGYLFDHGHLSRAICCRLDKVEKLDDSLPMPYYLNHPWIGCVTKYDPPRETEKTNNISINWCAIDKCPEVTDGRIGACLTRTHNAPTPSRLCKYELMKLFKECIILSKRNAHLMQTENYGELKQKAVEFQVAKKCMVAKFEKLKFGQWIRKPAEQEMFACF